MTPGHSCPLCLAPFQAETRRERRLREKRSRHLKSSKLNAKIPLHTQVAYFMLQIYDIAVFHESFTLIQDMNMCVNAHGFDPRDAGDLFSSGPSATIPEIRLFW